MSINSKNKYRPSLSSGQILHIIAICKRESPISAESISVVASLADMQFKIENSAIKPAYSTTPKLDILESLGEEPEIVPGLNGLSKEEIWEIAFDKWCDDPVQCTLLEIAGAEEHRYLNGLMNIEEMAEFELKPTFDVRNPKWREKS